MKEWHWRENRRKFCLDDWKPNPPWNQKGQNEYMRKGYFTDRESQYICDYRDEKNFVP